MLRFVPDQFITKRVCTNFVKELAFVIRYVPDRYKTQKICDKVILEFVPDCYKTEKISNKTVDTSTNVLILVHLHLILFLRDIRPKRWVIKLFPKILLC